MPGPPVNVKQVLIYLTQEQHAKLLRLKKRTGVAVSAMIRLAIDRFLKSEDSKR